MEEQIKAPEEIGIEVATFDTKKKQLELEKLSLEVQNLQDNGLSKFERIVKKRIVPVFLPFLTLLATVVFFCITWNDGEKAKAVDRYKSEVEMVGMVWDDMKSPDSAVYNTARNFLVSVFNANANYYSDDNEYLGIQMSQRRFAKGTGDGSIYQDYHRCRL